MRVAGDKLAELRDQIVNALTNGSVPARKSLLQSLVHEIRVDGRDRVVPWFRVPGGAEPKVRALGGWAHPALHKSNLSSELAGDAIGLPGIHAKMRRDGYRNDRQ